MGVSFDGATAATHDAVRGMGAFEAALAGLRNLRREGIRAQMEVVLSRANAHEAIAFVELAERMDASEVNFSGMTAVGRGALRAGDLLDHDLWKKLVETLRATSRLARIPVTPNCAFLGTCFANVEPHVTCDGWMSPCYLSTAKLFRILDTDPATMRAVLSKDRLLYQSICGRRAWTNPNYQAFGHSRAVIPV